MLVVHHLNWMEWLRMHLIASYVAHVSLIVVRVKSIRGMLMIIDTEAEHIERFHAAGFGSVQKWFQCLNWASFLVRPTP